MAAVLVTFLIKKVSAYQLSLINLIKSSSFVSVSLYKNNPAQ